MKGIVKKLACLSGAALLLLGTTACANEESNTANLNSLSKNYEYVQTLNQKSEDEKFPDLVENIKNTDNTYKCLLVEAQENVQAETQESEQKETSGDHNVHELMIHKLIFGAVLMSACLVGGGLGLRAMLKDDKNKDKKDESNKEEKE